MTAPCDWSPEPEPWHEPDADATGLFWLAFIAGILLAAIIVAGTAALVMWGGW